jgi:tetratricopeptide (TPR) repeat protein
MAHELQVSFAVPVRRMDATGGRPTRSGFRRTIRTRSEIDAMGATRNILWAAAVAVGVVLPAAAAPSPTADDTPQKKLLRLNELTGDDAALGKIFEFVEEGRAAKSLLQEAAKIAKDKGKEQPFNVNATFVLAKTAELLRETDVAETFYRIHIDQTLQLMSWEKLGEGYTGLIKTLYQDRRFEESEKVCQEFLSINDRDKESLKLIKPGVLRQMVLIMGKEGKTDKATELIDKIIQSQPDNPLNHITKGQFLVDRGKMDEAVGATRRPSSCSPRTKTCPRRRARTSSAASATRSAASSPNSIKSTRLPTS